MSSKIIEYCSIISDYSIKNAAILSERFKKGLELKSESEVFENYIDDVLFFGFSFLGYLLSFGIWSNLSNDVLRGDLDKTLKEQIILRVGKEKANSSDSVSVAAEASKVFAVLDEFWDFIIQRFHKLDSSSIPLDGNAALLVILEWIQAKLKIPESVMNKAVLNFKCDDCIDEIEKTALQINVAAGEEL